MLISSLCRDWGAEVYIGDDWRGAIERPRLQRLNGLFPILL